MLCAKGSQRRGHKDATKNREATYAKRKLAANGDESGNEIHRAG